MARKANDLLDIFRLSDERDEAEAKSTGRTKRGPKRGPKRAKKTQRARPAANDEPVALSRKHMLYAGSVVVLLLALTFVLGIAAGIGDEPDPSALRREAPTATWYVRGRLPKIDWTDSQPIDIRDVARRLIQRHGVKKETLTVRQTAEHYFLYLGPFGDEDEAHSYLEIRAIDGFSVGGQFPFARPEVVAGQKRSQ